MKNKKIFIYYVFYLLFCIVPRADAVELDFHDRMLLAQRLASDVDHITLLIATKDGRQEEFLSFVKKNNIKIRFASDELGYFRLWVPVKLVHYIAAHSAVLGANLSTGASYAPNSTAQKPLSANTVEPKIDIQNVAKVAQPDSPLYGLEEMGVVSLQKQHPTYDGRGVTIAVLEAVPDIGAPELQTAKALDGSPVPKFTAIYGVLSLEPEERRRPLLMNDKSVVRLSQLQRVGGGALTVAGRRVLVPSSGEYQTAYLDETLFGLHAGDFNKDGNPNSKPRTFAIARKVGASCLMIDLNQNDDLRDDGCLVDYNADPRQHRFASHSRRKPGTPFVLVKTENPDLWIVGIPGEHAHLTHLSASGDRLFGSQLTSSAPAARFITLHGVGWSIESSVEAAIRAANDPRVDIILNELVQSRSFVHSKMIDSIIFERIVKKKNKVIVAPGGNELSRVATIHTGAGAAAVLTIGQFFAAATKELILGHASSSASAGWSSGGPMDDGRLKPDVLAPSLGIFPMSEGFDADAFEMALVKKACPNIVAAPGIACYSGTSMATPVAAGAVAALISAAKQRGIAYTAHDIYKSVVRTARHVPGDPTYKQGNGVVNIPAALAWLSQNAGHEQPEFIVSAPVRTMLSHQLSEPNRGSGLFEQEGWAPGGKGIRNVTVRRVSGRHSESQFQLSLIGNTSGTFKVPRSITLPLGKSVEIPVMIEPRYNGIHSAILQIESGDDPLERIALTVIAASPLTAANDFKAVVEAENRPGWVAQFFVQVPANAVALRARMTPPINGIYPMLVSPTGSATTHPELSEILDFATEPDAPGTPAMEQAYYYPTSGVWHFLFPDFVDTRHPVPIQVEFEAVTAQFMEKEFAALANGGGLQQSAVRNNGETFVRSVLGKKTTGTATFRQTDLPKIIDLDIPTNVDRIDVKVREISPQNGKPQLVSAMVFDCGPERCNSKGFATGAGQTGFFVRKPKKGKWRLSVDAMAPSKGETIIEYEVFVSVQDKNYKEVVSDTTTSAALVSEIENPGFQCFIEVVSNNFRNFYYQWGAKRKLEGNVTPFDELIPIIDQNEIIPLKRVLGVTALAVPTGRAMSLSNSRAASASELHCR